MTNFDRIKDMSVEELADLLCEDNCRIVNGNNRTCDGGCESCIREWLESEVQGE